MKNQKYNIEFKDIKDFNRGILLEQLKDGYSFDSNWEKEFLNDWVEYDNFIFDNIGITNNCGFITCVDGVPVGHITWDPRNKPDYVTIGHNTIKTQYKGLGIGNLELLEAIRRIKQYKDLKEIVVTTNNNLIPAKNNYEKVGFVLVKRRKNLDTPFSGDYLDYHITL